MTGAPVILFGAFDRHNFGDLLFPHIAAAVLGTATPIFAGLKERDLRNVGGHQVESITTVAACVHGCPVHLVHAGGEILTCDAWEAAVMLSPPEQAQDVIARFHRNPRLRLKWARDELHVSSLGPYTVSPALFPQALSTTYNAVGGIDLNRIDPAMRAEVLAKLRLADDVAVRDRQTQTLLKQERIAARLIPDPAVMVAELFGTAIRRRFSEGEVAAVLHRLPQGYVAVQFSADFGDDRTLADIAAQLDRIAATTGCGVVFFRAGAAPWHDDLACYQRTAARMQASTAVEIFSSLDLWDICALIAGSRAFCGSSLHGRIVATAFARPRVSVHHPALNGKPTKQGLYAATWDESISPASVAVTDIAERTHEVLAADPGELEHIAEKLVRLYRQGVEPIRARLA